MKTILIALIALLFAGSANSSPLPPSPVGSLPLSNGFDWSPLVGHSYGDVPSWNGTTWTPAGSVGDSDAPSLFQTTKAVNGIVANAIYTTGLTTYSSGTYTAGTGVLQLPTKLQANQIIYANFNQTNPASANFVLGKFPAKALKIVNSQGSIVSMTGGEITAGPATLYYDGVEIIYGTFVAGVVPATGTTAPTKSDFVNHTHFPLEAGSQSFTLPCSTSVSPNGYIAVSPIIGTATINLTSSSCSDHLTKNNTTGLTTTTIAQGEGAEFIYTNGAGVYYVTGQ